MMSLVKRKVFILPALYTFDHVNLEMVLIERIDLLDSKTVKKG